MNKLPSLRKATCLACGYQVAVPIFDGGKQPLATLAWPSDVEAACDLPRLPLDFVSCVDCGHVFNVAFDYSHVPYSGKPNLMFNSANIWSQFVRDVCSFLLDHLPERPVVVEIGHGDGSFLSALGEARPGGRYVGFDPHGATSDVSGLEFRTELFDPVTHLAELTPNMVISRHVLEHMTNPLAFLQQLSFAATCLKQAPLAYFEVPCIDRTLEIFRTVDFYYEHSSQFTTASFTRMLERCKAEVLDIRHGYGGEVVSGFARLGGPGNNTDATQIARKFRAEAEKALAVVMEQLAQLYTSGRPVAIWGGTGKSAAFMCRYGVDRKRFPTVVDSDWNKVGTFVPGTGQEIRFRDWLVSHAVEVVIIPPQWRAADILAEMREAGITAEQVLIEHNGRLIDFHRDEHPYFQT
jgi:hypothetical protein